MTKWIFAIWLAGIIILGFEIATFPPEEHVSGSTEASRLTVLVFVLLCLPSSVLSLPLALMGLDFYSDQNWFVHNEQHAIFIWLIVHIIFALAQWAFIFWLIKRRKNNPARKMG
ncbi:hypothetical protein [Pseudomonas sp. GD03944]|uniref:hypothetical protein n=1 Tax=Pseudomonas sp. GD03944 TaxID=2975409 RepID=UPI00244CA74D|nr:hypothetical protein [Pseudomonas sp. GD03944]MDH1262764.1 hypothetical protein [Pseudomonas sp. GD03944]